MDPSQFRWKPLDPKYFEGSDFIQGIMSMCGAGSPEMKNGLGIHLYGCNQSMKNTAFYSADGEMLIVPQQGDLHITTEFGRLKVSPLEICVIPRGIKFKVEVD